MIDDWFPCWRKPRRPLHFRPIDHYFPFQTEFEKMKPNPKRSCQNCRHYDPEGLDNLRYTWGCKLGMIEVTENRLNFNVPEFDNEEIEKLFFALGCEEYDNE